MGDDSCAFLLLWWGWQQEEGNEVHEKFEGGGEASMSYTEAKVDLCH